VDPAGVEVEPRDLRAVAVGDPRQVAVAVVFVPDCRPVRVGEIGHLPVGRPAVLDGPRPVADRLRLVDEVVVFVEPAGYLDAGRLVGRGGEPALVVVVVPLGSSPISRLDGPLAQSVGLVVALFESGPLRVAQTSNLAVVRVGTRHRGAVGIGSLDDSPAGVSLELDRPTLGVGRSRHAAHRVQFDARGEPSLSLRFEGSAAGLATEAVEQRPDAVPLNVLDLSNAVERVVLDLAEELVVPEGGDRPVALVADDLGADEQRLVVFLSQCSTSTVDAQRIVERPAVRDRPAVVSRPVPLRFDRLSGRVSPERRVHRPLRRGPE